MIVMRLIPVLLLWCAVGVSFAQTDERHPILESVDIRTDHRQVYLHWVISGGNTCNGIFIHRTTDTTDGNWTLIGDIQGICGSTEYAEPYDFTDPSPIPNTINYYRITFGTQGDQKLQIEFVDLKDQPALVRPNPIAVAGEIIFDQQQGEAFTFEVSTVSGKIVYTSSNINNGKIPVPVTHLKKGTYLFRIYNDKRTIKGKFQIVK